MHARENAGLAHHGDADLVPGLVDLAVNVRSSGTPSWLATRIREADLAAYPDQRAAGAAGAARPRPGGAGADTAPRGCRPPSVHRAGGGPARRRPPGRPADPAVPVHA